MFSVLLQVLEDHLSTKHKGEWIAGPEFTAADIMLSYTLELLHFASSPPAEVPVILTADKYPEAAAYWQRMQVREAMRIVNFSSSIRTCGDHLICAVQTNTGYEKEVHLSLV